MINITSLIEDRVFGGIQQAGAHGQRSQRSGPITALEVTQLISKGIDGAVLQRISKRIPRAVLAETLGTDVSNFAKLYHRTLTKPQTDEINDLTLLWSELREFFEDDRELMDEWLNAAVPALSDAQPWDLLSTFTGRQAVRTALDAMRYGDFS